jgi:hypothetical protein
MLPLVLGAKRVTLSKTTPRFKGKMKRRRDEDEETRGDKETKRQRGIDRK